MNHAPTPPNRPTTKLSWRKKLLFSCVVTVSFFALVEASLVVLGVQRHSDTSDPFIGFDAHFPLMKVSVLDDGEEIVATSPNKLIWFNYQEFPRQKSANVQRVFCLGGSTTYGRPYQDLTSYSGWLREFLPLADPEHQWEVINAGGVSYASYRVAALMEELAQYQPDLFIVYTAHNEFLERRTYADMFQRGWTRPAQSLLMRTRTWSVVQSLADRVRQNEPKPAKEMLPGEVDEMLNHSIGPQQYHRDPQWRQNVLKHYEVNLSRMVKIAREAGAEIVFILPASNEMDCSPFKSEVREEIDDAESQRFRDLLKLAATQSRDADPKSALELYRQAAEIEPRYADLHYRVGKLLVQSGRFAEARQEFSSAINEDICPLRAVDEITASLRRVARQDDVPLVDFEASLRGQSLAEQGHECLGDAYFLDHVHPTTDVHRQLALWIMQSLNEHELANLQELSPAEIEVVVGKVSSQIDDTSRGVALRNLAKVLHWSGKFAEAAPRALDALQLIPSDPESQFVLADCYVNLGLEDQGFQQYETLFATGDFPRAYLPFGQLLAERGQFKRAKFYLTLAAVFHGDQPQAARAHYLIGCIELEEQEFELACDSLRLTLERFPDDPSTLSLLAEAEVGAGRTELGIELYQSSLEFDPANGEVHNRLGLLFLKQRQVDQAIAHFQSAIEADPSNAAAASNLEVARTIRAAR